MTEYMLIPCWFNLVCAGMVRGAEAFREALELFGDYGQEPLPSVRQDEEC